MKWKKKREDQEVNVRSLMTSWPWSWWLKKEGAGSNMLSALSHVSRWERNWAEAQQISSESLHSWIHLLHSRGLFLILFSARWKTTPSPSWFQLKHHNPLFLWIHSTNSPALNPSIITFILNLHIITPLYFLHAPHMLLRTPPTCDTHAPHIFVYCFWACCCVFCVHPH